MFERLFLKDLIEQTVQLGPSTASGFRPIKCAVCSDYKVRGAFKFDDLAVGYNCWNCGCKWVYDGISKELPGKAWVTLTAFGIPRNKITAVISSGFFSNSPEVITLEDTKPKISLVTQEIAFPPKTFSLKEIDDDAQIKLDALSYMESRKLDADKLDPHISIHPKYENRIIFPCWRDGKLIFWQARSIVGAEPKYISPAISHGAVVWGYDNLFRSNGPLYITEGLIDASFLNGIALLGSDLTPAQIQILEKLKRRKVVIPDKDSKGKRLADIARTLGFDIGVLPPNSKDVNESVIKNGKLYTSWYIISNVIKHDSTAFGSLRTQLAVDLNFLRPNGSSNRR